MFWVIQSNLYNEYGYAALLESVQRMEIPHVVVKPVPCSDKLVCADFDSHSFMGDISNAPDPEIDDSGLVMVCGSLTLGRIAKNRGWKPGCFHNENFEFVKWATGFGFENILNRDSITCKFRDLDRRQFACKEFFIRPVEDSKSFSGTVMTWDEFESWRSGILALENDMWILDGDTIISVASTKIIYTETRFFVVDGKIVTYSEYKSGNRVHYSHDLVSENVIKFAEEMVERWQPDRAFVLDIAETPLGMKVIEINCFNSAGFYDCNVAKIVDAVETMEF